MICCSDRIFISVRWGFDNLVVQTKETSVNKHMSNLLKDIINVISIVIELKKTIKYT